jgi:hypothetical protein
MVKDIYKDDQVVRYKVKCQKCSQTFIVYEVLASISDHPGLSSRGHYKPCLGSRKPGSLVETIPKGKKL